MCLLPHCCKQLTCGLILPVFDTEQETVSCKVACNIQEKVHADWSTKVQTTREDFHHCQEAVISAQPLSNQGESRKWRKSGAFPGEDGMDQQKKRQKVQKYLSELRNIIPSGGSVRFIE